MNIRTAIASEIDRLREVRNLSAEVGCRFAYSAEQLTAWLNRPLPQKMFELLSKGYVLVAEEQHEIVGYGAIDPANNEVEAIFVIPSLAGRGVGRVLLAALESLALELKLTTLHLSASLNAVSFYRGAGYVSSARGEFPLSESLVLEFESMEKRLGAAV